uniref:Uncharacterized protein n=1 Tax=Macrostomum lignano TaxID=282301 RepID=A0A1I8FH75_9PLAT
MFVAPSVTHSVKNSTLSVYERQVPSHYEDGAGIQLGAYSAQYFPVRPLLRAGESDGAWLVAHKAEERRRDSTNCCLSSIAPASASRRQLPDLLAAATAAELVPRRTGKSRPVSMDSTCFELLRPLTILRCLPAWTSWMCPTTN